MGTSKSKQSVFGMTSSPNSMYKMPDGLAKMIDQKTLHIEETLSSRGRRADRLYSKFLVR